MGELQPLPLRQAEQEAAEHHAAQLERLQRHVHARRQLFLFMAAAPRHAPLQQRQQQQIGAENAEEEHRAVLEDQHQVAAEIFHKRQADAHEKQDHVHHPAEQPVDQHQQRAMA